MVREGLFSLGRLMTTALTEFFTFLFEELTETFSGVLSNIFSNSQRILEYDFVVNTIRYAQILAFVLLSIKVMYEVFQTYIMYQNGDPDADPSGVLVRTLQAVAIIAFIPKLIEVTFIFGTKLANDIASISAGSVDNPWEILMNFLTGATSLSLILIILLILIATLLIALQTAIRGAELALLSVLGPIMALNITSSNKGTWNAWFKQLVILCSTQALQIFMYKGAMSLLTYELSNIGMWFLLGWLWVTVLTPKFLKQFIYTSGVGEVGSSLGRILLFKKSFK